MKSAFGVIGFASIVGLALVGCGAAPGSEEEVMGGSEEGALTAGCMSQSLAPLASGYRFANATGGTTADIPFGYVSIAARPPYGNANCAGATFQTTQRSVTWDAVRLSVEPAADPTNRSDCEATVVEIDREIRGGFLGLKAEKQVIAGRWFAEGSDSTGPSAYYGPAWCDLSDKSGRIPTTVPVRTLIGRPAASTATTSVRVSASMKRRGIAIPFAFLYGRHP